MLNNRKNRHNNIKRKYYLYSLMISINQTIISSKYAIINIYIDSDTTLERELLLASRRRTRSRRRTTRTRTRPTTTRTTSRSSTRSSRTRSRTTRTRGPKRTTRTARRTSATGSKDKCHPSCRINRSIKRSIRSNNDEEDDFDDSKQ